MKAKLSVLFVLFIASVTFTHAQSKKDIEQNLSRCNAAKDSIQNLLTGLSASYDSISTAFIAYDTMYNAIKEKVLLYDFDPANMSELIDSLSIEKSSEFTTILNDSLSRLQQVSDSLSLLQQENAELKEAIASMGGDDGDKTKLVEELKQLKELLDAQIITQEEFDAKKVVILEKL